MKFRSPKFMRLRVTGAGRFVDGVLETADPAAIARIEAVAERYGVHAVEDADELVDPVEIEGPHGDGQGDGQPPAGD